MRKSRKKTPGFSIAAGLLTVGMTLAPMAVQAEPIPITAGVFSILNGSDSLHLEGPRGFTLNATNIVPGVYDPRSLCQAGPDTSCLPGALISMETGALGSDLPALVTLDGHIFTTGIGSEDQGSALVHFVGSFVAPPFSADIVSVFSPFTFNGNVVFPSDISPEVVLLFGRGTARVDLARVNTPDGPRWDFQRATYDFESAAPVPEPGTLVLLGSGLVGCLIRRNRRGKVRNVRRVEAA